MATLSTDTPVSPLRQRVQHDMLMRSLGSRLRPSLRRVSRAFARHRDAGGHPPLPA